MKIISKYLSGIFNLSGIIYNLFAMWAIICVVCADNFRENSFCPSVFITWGDSLLNLHLHWSNIPLSLWVFIALGTLGSSIGFYRIYAAFFTKFHALLK